MHTINIVVGDWSGDGHGKTKTYIFECSHSPKDVQVAYESGATREQHRIINTIATHYDDNVLTENHIATLKELEYDFEMLECFGEFSDDAKYLNTDEYVDIYWHIVKRGNPEITYNEIKGRNITIGGYGFFY